MRDTIDQLKSTALKEVQAAGEPAVLEQVRIRYLGKKGELTRLLRGLGELPAEERPVVGKLANEVRGQLEAAIGERESTLAQGQQEQRLQAEAVDVTLPGRGPTVGSRHPLTLVLDQLTTIFTGLGFQAVEGPEVEWDRYNFQYLNMPVDHPARDMQDTFYVTDEIVLRTHTSPVQIRTMEGRRPPVRVITPGKVYRCDADVTHSPMFHQVEGLYVDQGVTFGDLKGTLVAFAEAMFGEGRGVRFRPSYFPFTEPSAEMDIQCVICDGSGCRVCSHEGWLEILGSGMVHPRVLEMVNYDPQQVSGFAFGMGLERIAMLKYGIDDIRLFFENDMRFLAQF